MDLRDLPMVPSRICTRSYEVFKKTREARVTSRVVINGTLLDGRSVRLRRPRLADAAAWSRARILDQGRIEPYWLTSSDSWEARNSASEWLAEFLTSTKNDWLGRTLHSVIEVDYQFSGQLNLEHIDPHPAVKTAELGIWVSSEYGGCRVGPTAIRMLVDHAFRSMGLKRIYAPVSVDNAAGHRMAERAGLIREGVLRSYLDVGGERRDHVIWAITAEDQADGSAEGLSDS